MEICISEKSSPVPSVTQAQGVAKMDGEETRFYVTIAPYALLLSVEPTPAGEKLIQHFATHLRKPTLQYRDSRGGYSDYTAEWYASIDRDFLAERIATHLRLGFSATDIKTQQVKTDE